MKKIVKEANKSGDSSLHDWFSKSKSSDGKRGWVQLGGRYAGKSCAKQPGQTTKPKCGSSKMAANMSDKEEDAAARRKREQDPDPNRSGAPINVPTEGKRKMKEETFDEACWAGYEKKGMKTMFGKRYPNCVKKESIDEYIANNECPECGGHMVSEDELTEEKDACYHKVKSRYSVWPSAYASGALVKCRKAGADNWGNKTKQEGTQLISFKAFIAEAANAAQQAAIAVNMKKKGIKPKNEEVELDEAAPFKDLSSAVKYGSDKVKTHRDHLDGIEVYKHKDGGYDVNHTMNSNGRNSLNKSGAKHLGTIYRDTQGKVSHNIKEEVELDENEDKVNARKMYHKHFVAAMKVMPSSAKQRHHQAEMAKYKAMMGDSFVDQVAPKKFAKFDKKTNEEVELDEVAAWQRKEGKNPEGGLNQKGIASYRAENPGSKLSTAVTTEPSKLKAGSKAANRRKSFCARMSGMKRKLTSAKTASDPDSRINKSLRKWNC